MSLPKFSLVSDLESYFGRLSSLDNEANSAYRKRCRGTDDRMAACSSGSMVVSKSNLRTHITILKMLPLVHGPRNGQASGFNLYKRQLRCQL
jgi:hypothetical protein